MHATDVAYEPSPALGHWANDLASVDRRQEATAHEADAPNTRRALRW